MPTGFYVLPRVGGLAYLNMPKAACTSILYALSQMRLDDTFSPPLQPLEDGSDPIHGFHPPHTHLEYFTGRWPVDYPPIPQSFIKFSFVRNPYHRLYSFYKSKIEMGQTPGNYYKTFGINKGCSFSKCIKIITSIDPSDLEHHAMPQSLIVYQDGKLLADFVGKVENITSDWQVIQQLTGLHIELGRANPTRDAKEPVYTPELKKRVYDYYRNDFELFEYNKDDIKISKAQTAQPGNEVSSVGRIPFSVIEKLKGQLIQSEEKVRNIANVFQQSPEKRKKYFQSQRENFYELTQKKIFYIDNKVEGLRNNLMTSQQAIDPIINTIPEQIEQLKKEASGDKVRIENLIKKVSNDKTQAQEYYFSKIEKIESLLAEEQTTSRHLKNAMVADMMASYSRNRKNIWKRMARFVKYFKNVEYETVCNSNLFDPQYYFTHYPTMKRLEMSGAKHYVLYGAQEGKNPSSKFNTIDYIMANPEVVHQGLNPLVHFILCKKK